MFNKIKELLSQNKKDVLYSPIPGQVVPISKVSDPTFGEEIIGKGVAIIPREGKVFAPVNGTISSIFPTLHAIAMVSDEGAEILIHIGLDTVKLKGEFFTAHTESGAKVNKGDLLLEFDIEGIKNAGYDVISPIVVCNVDVYSRIETTTDKARGIKDVIIALTKNAQ